MQPLEIRNEALELVAAGVNDCEIARRLGVPRTTVRDWRKPRYVPKSGVRSACPLCGKGSRRVVLEAASYAELFGLYLGDGHITAMPRAERLRIFLDAKYPTIVADTERLLRTVFPDNEIGRIIAHEGRMVVVWTYSRHLSCVFPQHGAGKKHERPITIEPWQRELVEAARWDFLRGCIRSDGCVFINRTGRYEYLSYEFTNLSTGILDLFEATCRQLGLHPRRYARAVRLYRRPDVASLLEHVGVKS
jgi:hypothetical protein